MQFWIDWKLQGIFMFSFVLNIARTISYNSPIGNIPQPVNMVNVLSLLMKLKCLPDNGLTNIQKGMYTRTVILISKKSP